MYKINWTSEAEKSFLKIINFWLENNQSNTYPLALIAEVERVENILAQNPYIGTKISATSIKTRRLVISKNYSMTYLVKSQNTIDILAFWDNRQDIEKHSF